MNKTYIPLMSYGVLHTLGVLEILLSAVTWLYEIVVGRFHTSCGFCENIESTIGVTKGCRLSPSLFGV